MASKEQHTLNAWPFEKAFNVYEKLYDLFLSLIGTVMSEAMMKLKVLL